MASFADRDRSVALNNYLKKKTTWNASKSMTRVSIFDLPDDILRSLIPAVPVSTSAQTMNVPFNTSAPVVATEIGHGLTCRCCGVIFDNLSLQKEHFKSDDHVSMLKRSIRGSSLRTSAPADGSISDDAQDSGEDSDQGIDDNELLDDTESSTIARGLIVSVGEIQRSYTKQYGSQYIMSAATQHHWRFCVSTAIVDLSSSNDVVDEEILRAVHGPWGTIYHTLANYRDQRMWAVFILRSGKFAGGLFDGNTVIAHKIFRRYTVRAKAGGSQSSHDNKGGKAKSAGAMMRRAGEQALREEIKQLIRDWGAYLDTCSLVLVSVPKVMRSVLFDDHSDSSSSSTYPLQRDDPRVRSIPFMIDVPTFENVQKVHSICSSVIFSEVELDVKGDPAVTVGDSSELLSSSSLEQMLEQVGLEASMALKSIPEVPAPPSAIEAATEELEVLISSDQSLRNLLAACRNGDHRAVKAMIKQHNSSVAIGPMDDDSDEDEAADDQQHTLVTSSDQPSLRPLSEFIDLPESIDDWRTALHIASEKGHDAIVTLLLKAGANPSIRDVRGRSAYQLARDKDTRDAFRRYRGSSPQIEALWNWDELGVGPPLTEDLEKLKREKEKEKKKRAKARKKEQKERDDAAAAELVARQAREAQEAEIAKAQRLEQAKANAGQCACCGMSLFGIQPFDVFDRRCCSSECVIKLRRRLAAEAAEKRLQGSTQK